MPYPTPWLRDYPLYLYSSFNITIWELKVSKRCIFKFCNTISSGTGYHNYITCEIPLHFDKAHDVLL